MWNYYFETSGAAVDYLMNILLAVWEQDNQHVLWSVPPLKYKVNLVQFSREKELGKQ